MDRPLAAQPRPDLQGIWQFYNPRNPKVVAASFNVIQTGDRVTIQSLPEGKPETKIFEGVFESNTILAGQAVDTRSPGGQWSPLKVIVKDAYHIELDAGLLLTRASSLESAKFTETRRLSFLPLPTKPFDLNGTWGFDNGARVELKQSNGEIVMMSADGRRRTFFRGQYTRNPVIEGQGLAQGSTPENPRWIQRNLVVEGPDQVKDGGLDMHRVSKPQSHDIQCDAQNSNHVTDTYAFARGMLASSEKDYKTARCWFVIAGEWELPAAQIMLSALLMRGDDGSTPDPVRAFELAKRSAENGDMDAQYLLAKAYEGGKGTPADPEKAKFWRNKAQQSESGDLWVRMQTGKITENGILDLFNAVKPYLDLVDFDFTPPAGCFSQSALGQRPTITCPR